MQSVDVFILGAGPAGCCAALNLARACRVLLVDRTPAPQPRAGESLPPAANQLLRDMGLLDDFRQQGHVPCFGNQSRWGSDEWSTNDFLRDPQGHGWHLDRPHFERWLRQQAIARGASLLAPASLEHIERAGDGWRITLNQADTPRQVQARIVLDAGGRTPVLAKALGAVRTQQDKLVCGWLLGSDRAPANVGVSTILATEHGWWYSAPLPAHQRIVAFYSDADLPGAARMREAGSLLQLAQQAGLHDWLGTDARFGYGAANSAITQPVAGDDWLCAGDAALSFDPLSSQGIFNALYTGLAAAESIYCRLRGESHDFAGYCAQIARIEHAYQQHFRHWYGTERRWPLAPFWQRRQNPGFA